MENLFNERVNNPQRLNLNEMVNFNGGAGPYPMDPGILNGSTGKAAVNFVTSDLALLIACAVAAIVLI